MKKTLYLLIFTILCLTSCRKEKTVSVLIEKGNEKITEGTTSVTFWIAFNYPTQLELVRINYSEVDKEYDDFINMNSIFNQFNCFNTIITELKANTTYKYYYDYYSGHTFSKSDEYFLKTKSTSELINGIKWASCNVDKPGTFTTNPEDAGMFYQWGSNVGWSSNDPLAATDEDNKWRDLSEKGNTWQPAKNPCPLGWRIPTYEELSTLKDKTKVTRIWTNQDGVNGYRLTDKATNASCFLPAVGSRSFNNGSLNSVGTHGTYWSNTPNSEYARNLGFSSDHFDSNGYMRTDGFSIRCVAEQ